MNNPLKEATTEQLKSLGSKYYNKSKPTTTEMAMYNLIVDELKVRLSKTEFTVWAINA